MWWGSLWLKIQRHSISSSYTSISAQHDLLHTCRYVQAHITDMRHNESLCWRVFWKWNTFRGVLIHRVDHTVPDQCRLLLLYYFQVGTNLGDFQYLYIDFCLATIFVLVSKWFQKGLCCCNYIFYSGAQWAIPCTCEAASWGKACQYQHVGEDGDTHCADRRVPSGSSLLPQEPNMGLVMVSSLSSPIIWVICLSSCKVQTFRGNRSYREGSGVSGEHNHFHNGQLSIYRSGISSFHWSTISKANLHKL